MKLSIVIPAHNEAGCIEKTALHLLAELNRNGIASEIVIVDDHSTDGMDGIVARLSDTYQEIKLVRNTWPNGFGYAVRTGLNSFSGDAVAIVMADGSDDPKDVVNFYNIMKSGYDCVFGSRFTAGGKAYDYPKFKYLINRMANSFIRMVFGLQYNDVTNAFKLYRRETIDGLKPFLSNHYNLTVELPLKAITRGYSYTVIPNKWYNREAGESKLRIKEMGSRYLFIVLYCFIENWLSVGDYRKPQPQTDDPPR